MFVPPAPIGARSSQETGSLATEVGGGKVRAGTGVGPSLAVLDERKKHGAGPDFMECSSDEQEVVIPSTSRINTHAQKSDKAIIGLMNNVDSFKDQNSMKQLRKTKAVTRDQKNSLNSVHAQPLSNNLTFI